MTSTHERGEKGPNGNRRPIGRRLYLFDIDGTLISTGGAGGAAMRAAFRRIWGLEDGFKSIEFSGRSDLAIIEDALRLAGLANGDPAALMRRFKRAYFRLLPESLVKHEGRVLPGVEALLRELATSDNVTLSLGTGNFRTSAGIKLRHYGLHGYFCRAGGFGDRTGHRPTLIAHGIRAANRAFGRHGSVFVIGDTVHDMHAAKANGAVAIGVATGTASEGELSAAGADIVYSTLEAATELLQRPF